MKKFFRTSWGKLVLIGLLVLFMFLTVASVFTALFIYQRGVYLTDQQSMLYDMNYRRINQSAQAIVISTLFNGMPYTQTNLVYMIEDENGNILYQSQAENLYEDTERVIYSMLVTVPVEIYSNKTGEPIEKPFTYIFTAYIDEEMAYDDIYKFINITVRVAYALKYLIYPAGVVCFCIMSVAFVALMNVSGRSSDDELLHPGPLNALPLEVVTVIPVILLTVLLREALDSFLSFILVAAFALAYIIWLCMNIAVRVKEKTLLKNTLMYKTYEFIVRIYGYVIRNLALVWKIVLAAALLTAAELLYISQYGFPLRTRMSWFVIIDKLIVIPAILYFSVGYQRLKKYGHALARGDTDYVFDDTGLTHELKDHAEDLGKISDTIDSEVEKRMHSELMKTELITNVSHDIKTPLTSIINYSELISRKDSTEEERKQYAEVLSRQSRKLKRLIEDLIEISKATTGNMEVELEPCDVNIFVGQAGGEYEDRLAVANVRLVSKTLDEPVMVMADPRKMWRVFDNLIGNMVKYSMPGTRAFIETEKMNGKVFITFKNTSKDELDMTGEELTERFVRNDRSRNTEGSGLGLPIAKSIMELMGGIFNVYIDGDMFKAILIFDEMPQNHIPDSDETDEVL